jgi:NitT/TauT family transport system substrate-binding protein
MRRLLAIGLLVGAVALASAGVAPGKRLGAAMAAPDAGVAIGAAGAPAAVAAQRVNLRFGNLPVTAFLGMYVAREWGWLEEEGINLDLVTMSGGAEILPAMIGGSLDVGITNTFSHVLARDQGFDVKAVAAGGAERAGEPTHAILVQPNSPIQSARDLDGRTMATNTLNNIDHLMQMTWLRNNGVDVSRVNIVEIPFPQHPAALSQGRVDAIGPTEPFVSVAASQGARVLAYHYTDTNPVTLIAYYAATGDWLNRNADTGRRFARAIHRANSFLQDNRDEKRAAAARHLNISPDILDRLGIEELQTRVDPAQIQWWVEAGRRFNLVSSQHNPADFLWETVQ